MFIFNFSENVSFGLERVLTSMVVLSQEFFLATTEDSVSVPSRRQRMTPFSLSLGLHFKNILLLAC